LATYKNRKLSAGDLFLSFGAAAFPIHVWAIINLLMIFPAWMLRMTLWELAGAIGYPLSAALLESLLLWLVLVIIGYILPRKLFADRFAAQSALLAWLLSGLAMLLHYKFGIVLQWGTGQVILAALLVTAFTVLILWSVKRFGKLEGWIKIAAQRLALLSYIYVFFDLIGLVVVILRNL
jgi:hypothetical protein